jgi:hypothetical protein
MLGFAVRALGSLALSGVLFAAAAAQTGERISTLADQRGVGITIYNDDLALVRDRRRLTIPAGESQLALRDVSARIQPETALLQSIGAPGRIGVLEQNFNYDLLSPQKLLEKYVGRDVDVVRTNPVTGAQTRERARVLATNGGIVLRYADRIETSIDGRLAFPELPADLRDRPTLVTTVTNRAAGPQDVELTYLSGGLSWKADYTALLNPGDDRLDLRGLITLQNQSGTTYRNAMVQLVAGDVNVVRGKFMPSMTTDSVGIMPVPAPPREQALFEYHLYTLQRRTTVADNQTKGVELLTAPSVPVTKSLELRGEPTYYYQENADLGSRLKVGTYVTFQNRGGALGIPLPKGIVRVYKRDNGGNEQFVGSDAIDHTAKNEDVRLHLGDSFDVTASKKQTDYKRVSPSVYDTAYTIVLRNAKKTAQRVLVVEPIPGDWTMLESSAPFRKTSATATWSMDVPAGGSTMLTYRVRTRWG